MEVIVFWSHIIAGNKTWELTLHWNWNSNPWFGDTLCFWKVSTSSQEFQPGRSLVLCFEIEGSSAYLFLVFERNSKWYILLWDIEEIALYSSKTKFETCSLWNWIASQYLILFDKEQMDHSSALLQFWEKWVVVVVT